MRVIVRNQSVGWIGFVVFSRFLLGVLFLGLISCSTQTTGLTEPETPEPTQTKELSGSDPTAAVTKTPAAVETPTAVAPTTPPPTPTQSVTTVEPEPKPLGSTEQRFVFDDGDSILIPPEWEITESSGRHVTLYMGSTGASGLIIKDTDVYSFGGASDWNSYWYLAGTEGLDDYQLLDSNEIQLEDLQSIWTYDESWDDSGVTVRGWQLFYTSPYVLGRRHYLFAPPDKFDTAKTAFDDITRSWVEGPPRLDPGVVAVDIAIEGIEPFTGLPLIYFSENDAEGELVDWVIEPRSKQNSLTVIGLALINMSESDVKLDIDPGWFILELDDGFVINPLDDQAWASKAVEVDPNYYFDSFVTWFGPVLFEAKAGLFAELVFEIPSGRVPVRLFWGGNGADSIDIE